MHFWASVLLVWVYPMIASEAGLFPPELISWHYKRHGLPYPPIAEGEDSWYGSTEAQEEVAHTELHGDGGKLTHLDVFSFSDGGETNVDGGSGDGDGVEILAHDLSSRDSDTVENSGEIGASGDGDGVENSGEIEASGDGDGVENSGDVVAKSSGNSEIVDDLSNYHSGENEIFLKPEKGHYYRPSIDVIIKKNEFSREKKSLDKSDFQETVIIMKKPRFNEKKSMYIIGGKFNVTGCTSSNNLGDDPCAIRIQRYFDKNTLAYTNEVLSWSGFTDNKLEREYGIGATLDQSRTGRFTERYHPHQRGGRGYYILRFRMDCSQTKDGLFEVRGVYNGQLEPQIRRTSCVSPFNQSARNNHVAYCGFKNVFYWGKSVCRMKKM